MKYTIEVRINKPLDRVVDLFSAPQHLPKWQPGLKEVSLLEGEVGQAGARSKIRFDMGFTEMEMIETVELNALPKAFIGTYQADGVFNRVVNRFEKVDENTTLYATDQEFRFSGFMQLMGWFLPDLFKKQAKEYLQRFKIFVESYPD